MFPEQQYNVLLESGELFELFPTSNGIWEEDKYFFNLFVEKNEEAIEDFDITIHLGDDM